MSKPLISVIIASYNSSKTIKKTLNSLIKQKDAENYEIIVVDSSTDNTAKIISRQFPGVRLYTFTERLFPGSARNFGVAQAKGTILAFTDADCIVGENWIHEIIKAHNENTHIVGGVIRNGNPESYVGWGHYFCEFSQWMPGSKERLMDEIPTGCLSFKRWVFDKYGPFLDDTYCSDTAFHWKLREDGYKSLLIPTIYISHSNIINLFKFLRKQSFHGRSFAKVRVNQKKFSNTERLIYAFISPILPIILFYRISTRVLKNRIYLKRYIFSLPIVILGLVMWSFGEFQGYLGIHHV